MTLISSVCGAESTIVHVATQRPALGVLICAALAAGGYSQMTGTPDAFGGCGEPGGELHRVIELTEDPALVCAVPEEAPVQKEP